MGWTWWRAFRSLTEGLLAQKPDDNNKLYASHVPEVVCISKGKAHKRDEFGCEVGIMATNREGLFLAAMAFEGNPYDGHTLKATAAKTEEITGVAIQHLYVGKGYRGHDYDGKTSVMISRNERGLTPTMKREFKRHSAIEPMIGHAKNDGRLGRNYLLGADAGLLAKAGQISIAGDTGSVSEYWPPTIGAHNSDRLGIFQGGLSRACRDQGIAMHDMRNILVCRAGNMAGLSDDMRSFCHRRRQANLGSVLAMHCCFRS